MNVSAEKTTPPAAALAEACPLCNQREWTALFSAKGYTIARCASCALVRTLGAASGSDALYPAFDQRDTFTVRAMRAGVQQLLRERASVVTKVRASGRILDFGCGNGAFAELMARQGWDCVGLEPFSLGEPTEKTRLKLIRGPLDSHRNTLGEFDVITMWHVLEHLDDPVALLSSLSEHLRPDGSFVVSVPNFASWQARLFGGDWFHLDPPRHVTHFEEGTLRALFEKLDLDIVSERTFHVEYGPVGWIQSALNLVLPRPNFIYEFVKDRGALANVPKMTTAMNLAASVVGGTALLGPAFLAEAAAAGARGGSVLTVVARKRGAAS